jgi:hypothetical protein
MKRHIRITIITARAAIVMIIMFLISISGSLCCELDSSVAFGFACASSPLYFGTWSISSPYRIHRSTSPFIHFVPPQPLSLKVSLPKCTQIVQVQNAKERDEFVPPCPQVSISVKRCSATIKKGDKTNLHVVLVALDMVV